MKAIRYCGKNANGNPKIHFLVLYLALINFETIIKLSQTPLAMVCSFVRVWTQWLSFLPSIPLRECVFTDMEEGQ